MTDDERELLLAVAELAIGDVWTNWSRRHGPAIADNHTENARALLRRVRRLPTSSDIIHATEQAEC